MASVNNIGLIKTKYSSSVSVFLKFITHISFLSSFKINSFVMCN